MKRILYFLLLFTCVQVHAQSSGPLQMEDEKMSS